MTSFGPSPGVGGRPVPLDCKTATHWDQATHRAKPGPRRWHPLDLCPFLSVRGCHLSAGTWLGSEHLAVSWRSGPEPGRKGTAKLLAKLTCWSTEFSSGTGTPETGPGEGKGGLQRGSGADALVLTEALQIPDLKSPEGCLDGQSGPEGWEKGEWAQWE